MRKVVIPLFAFFILSACTSNEKTGSSETKMVLSDIASESLKGDISSYEDSPYKTDSTGKVGEMDSCCISTSEFDENGNAIKYQSKDSRGVITSESATTRHPNGLFKSQTYSEKGKVKSSFDTKLDDHGKYTSAQALDSNGKLDIYYTDIVQNDDAFVTSWKQYDKDSVFRQSGENVFNKHLQMSFTLKDSVGKVKSSSANKYNDKNELIETSNTTVTKDSTTTKVTKYTYDSHDEMGNWTQRTTWDDTGKATAVTKRKYTYRKK